MVYNKTGDTIVYDGKMYAVGDTVVVEEVCPWKGLVGKILEIYDGKDRETENDGGFDIVCRFEPPTDAKEIKALEDTFSDWYRCPKTIEDISLDMVIFTPEDIRVTHYVNQPERKTLDFRPTPTNVMRVRFDGYTKQGKHCGSAEVEDSYILLEGMEWRQWLAANTPLIHPNCHYIVTRCTWSKNNTECFATALYYKSDIAWWRHHFESKK